MFCKKYIERIERLTDKQEQHERLVAEFNAQKSISNA